MSKNNSKLFKIQNQKTVTLYEVEEKTTKRLARHLQD